MPNIPLIIPAGAVRASDYMGPLMDWKATAEQTGGAFSIVEAKGSTGTEPPLHYHENADELFYVVDGAMTFKVGNDIKKITNGGFVWIPRKVVHGFLINSDVSRFLFGFVPAGLERLFIEASRVTGDPTKRASVPAGSNREQFGTIVVGPPLGEWLQNRAKYL